VVDFTKGWEEWVSFDKGARERLKVLAQRMLIRAITGTVVVCVF